MRSIIIYFSRADENYGVGVVTKGNTEILAEYIQEFTQADMFKVERITDYPKSYRECTEFAQKELDANIRPKLKNSNVDISNYDIIYIGYPIWWGTMPMPMFTLLSKLNFEGKIIRPFCTHEGSGFSASILDLKRMCKGAIFEEGLSIKGSSVKSSKGKVENWLS